MIRLTSFLSMVSVCLPSDALLQHLPSYLGFSYLGCGVSIHGCSSKAQPLLLTLDEGYLLTTALPDIQHGIAPLGPPVLRSHHSSGCSSWPPALASSVGWLLLAAAPGLGHEVASPGFPWPRMRGRSSWPLPLTLDVRCLLLATGQPKTGGS